MRWRVEREGGRGDDGLTFRINEDVNNEIDTHVY